MSLSHPNGDYKKVYTTNISEIIEEKVDGINVLLLDLNTESGSSGSSVFNSRLQRECYLNAVSSFCSPFFSTTSK